MADEGEESIGADPRLEAIKNYCMSTLKVRSFCLL